MNILPPATSLGAWLRRFMLVPPLDMTPRALFSRILFAFILALILWVRVSSTQDPARSFVYGNVPVIASYPPRYYPTQGLPPIEVRVNGLSSDLSASKHIFGAVFVTKPLTSSTSQRVQVHVSGLSSRLEILSISPRYVTVQLDKALTKTVPIVIQPINPPPGYDIGKLRVSPSTVTVIGPSHVIRDILQARVVLSEQGLTHEQTFQAQPAILNNSGQSVNKNNFSVQPSSVSITADVHLQPIHQLVPILPDIQGVVAPGYRISGLSVDPPLLPVLSKTGSSSLATLRTDTIDVSGWSSSHILAPAIVVPSSLTLGSTNRVTVTVSVLPANATSSSLANVSVTGLRPGYKTILIDPVVTVSYQGPVNDLDQSPTVSIDISHLKQGTYTLRPTVTLGPSLGVISVTPSGVRVTVLGS